jgi:putative peptidoglycan lipid II flippase
MNLALIGPLGHAGLALAIGLGACLNAGLLCRYLRSHGIYTPEPGWGAFVLKVALAVALMAAALWTAAAPGAWWTAVAWQSRVTALAGLVALGLAVYGGVLLALGFRLRDFSRRSA